MSTDRRGKNVMPWKKCPFLYGSFTWLKIQLQTLAYKRQRKSKKEEWEERRKWDWEQRGIPWCYKKRNSLNWRNNFFQPTAKKNNSMLGENVYIFRHMHLQLVSGCELTEFPAHVGIKTCGMSGRVGVNLFTVYSRLSAYYMQLVTVHHAMKKIENKHWNNV